MAFTTCAHYERIAIWGDDELVARALVREVRARQPGAEALLLARDPDAAGSRHDLEAWSLEMATPRAALRCWRRLASCDLLIVAGARPFGESLPDLCRWTTLARLVRTPVHMLSVGAGSLAPGVSRMLVKRALDAASYLSFRDPQSEAQARALGVRRDCAVVPDLAFSLEREPVSREGGGSVVVGVRPDDALVRSRGFETCVQKHLGFLGWLLAERYEVRLFHASEGEQRLCQRLEEDLRDEGVLRAGKQLVHPEPLSSDAMLDAMARCDFVVAGGFHGILIPALSGVPVVGLTHSSQSQELVQRLGQDRYAANIDRFGTPQLVDSFCSLRANAEKARDLLKLRIPECREAVRMQYDGLYGPVVEA